MRAIAWSSTWSRTSTRSSTSEPAPGLGERAGPAARIGGLIRLTHPFPCLLDGLVVAAVAVVAGADPVTALRLGVAMTALQASIGALNDIVDAPRDEGRKHGKPIPTGLVSQGLARAVAVAAAGLGVGLSAPSGAATLGLAVVVLAIGYGYDLRLKGTVWSWFPFAIGIPLLPVFGWLGTTGGLPGSFALLLPVAIIAGAALAVANARADAERDAAAGVESVATRLGLERAWAINAILLAVVVGLAVVTLLARATPMVVLLGAASAGLIIGLGVARGRGADSAGRERAWELEAVGVGFLAAAWLAGATLGQ
jgi:4-hydroxybenzoate polyprenyltransferase